MAAMSSLHPPSQAFTHVNESRLVFKKSCDPATADSAKAQSEASAAQSDRKDNGLHIIYATTSGHTEYVVDELVAFLKEKAPDLEVEVQRAEQAQPEDLQRGDVLLLGCGTWNIGGIEGQLDPHMHEFLLKRSKEADLGGKPVAAIALGDDRYKYTIRATEHLMQFILNHNGKGACPPLAIVNEPYGQEEKIRAWGDKLLSAMQSL